MPTKCLDVNELAELMGSALSLSAKSYGTVLGAGAGTRERNENVALDTASSLARHTVVRRAWSACSDGVTVSGGAIIVILTLVFYTVVFWTV